MSEPLEKRPRTSSAKRTTRTPSPDPQEVPAQSPGELPDYEIDKPSRRRNEILKEALGDLRVRIVAAILILAVLATLTLPPAYRKVKVWRAMRLMEECQTAADNGNVPHAINLMRRAVLMAPNNEAVFRNVRLLNASLGDPGALGALQVLLLENKTTPDEILVLAEQSLKSGKTVLAREALLKLKTHPSARRTIVEMRLLDSDGNRQEAVDLARASLPEFPPADADKILLATAEMILKTHIPTSQEILLPLAKKSTPTGIAALRLLAAQQLIQPGSGSVKSSDIATALTVHPLHSGDDLLLAADLQITDNPDSKPALIAALRQSRANSPEQDSLALARWLNRRMFYKDAIEFVGRERALSDSKWLLIYLDAHAGLDRWNDVFAMLDAETVVGLSESIRLLFLARAADESGDHTKAEDTWREMHRGLAYEKPEVVSFIAAYAMRIGERDQAIKAYTTLSRGKETALEGFLGLIRCWPSDAPASELIPVYKEFLETYPNLGEARCDLAYLQLLANQNIFEAAATARDLYQAAPSSLAPLSVAALGHLKTGEASQADALYEGKLIPWSTAPAPWRTVRAAVLYATGKTVEANELAATIKKSQLRPEERALLPAD